MIWPPDYQAEFERRLANLNRLNSDLQLRQKVMLHYAYNCADWINDWCVTFDPRNDADSGLPRLMPFRLFPRQVEFIEFLLSCIKDKENGLVEKCRDVGATWVCCAVSVWLWLFWGGSVIGWGSRKEEYVDDKKDPKAIFPKIRQIIEYLPGWMRPPGFDMRVHATYMKIINPHNGSAITGEAGNNIGRGGRTTLYFKDESAHYEQPEMIEAALGDNTNVQIDISSVNGINLFHRKRMAGQEWYKDTPMQPGKTRVFIFDWRQHPQKNQEWHDKRRQKAIDEGLLHIFMQEVERNYNASQERIVIPYDWLTACIDAHIKLNLPIEGMTIAGQDIADGGGDKNALIIRKGILTQLAETWGGEAGEAAKIAVPHCIQYRVKTLCYDSIGVGTGFKTQINTMKEWPAWPKHLRVVPWNAGGEVLDPEQNIIPDDPQSPINKDQYENLKAQSWFRARSRVYKTYRTLRFGDKYPPGDLVSFDSSLPKLNELLMQISQAVWKPSKNGKTMIDKQPEGAISPNLADAWVMAYNPLIELSIFDVL